MTDVNDKPPKAAENHRPVGGRFGRPIGWIEQEIDHYVLNMIRVARGLPRLPPPELPAHPSILREKEVDRRTGIGRVQRWRLEKAGRFPKRVFLDGLGASDAAD
jgi:predicted DNA-binding transcriptional regulator AlpA